MRRGRGCDRAGWFAIAALGAAAADAPGQLRVATWNVTNYDGASGRDPSFQLAAYGEFQGRRMAPDVILAQELIDAAALDDFVAMLNSASGSPGDWAAAAFVDGPDTDQVLVYRTSRVVLLGSLIAAAGGSAPNHPRHVMRYDVRPVGYTGAGATLALYCSHMKSGSLQSDQERRLVEAQKIRDNAQTLNPAWHFLLGADLNIQSSAQAAYQELVGSQPLNTGRFFDPIRTPGDWNNGQEFRFVHTQEPATQMDDRLDQLLLSAGLLDGGGFDYVGSLTQAYSTSTWNDPDHSYRAWGNDGTSFDAPLKVNGNTMVGAAIAQALVTTVQGNGHLPVFLDLRVPAEVQSPVVVDFGRVPQGSIAQSPLQAWNAGNVALWGAQGIADLRYSLGASQAFGAPPGTFSDAAGGGVNTHTLTMDTGTPGLKIGTLTITSDAPDEPVRVVQLMGEVVAACYPDCTGDGGLTIADFGCFQSRFVASDPYADCNQDGGFTIADFGCFQSRFVAGCP